MEVTQSRESRIIINRVKAHRPCFDEPLGDGLTLRMMQIPGDSFTMGSPDDELERTDAEGPQHRVTVPGFYMGKYPITQAQWRFVASLEPVERAFEGSVPSEDPKRDNHPITEVSWYEAVEFCERLSCYTGRVYRLPSEAEWEYACRAGTTTPFHFGEAISTDLANYNGTDEKYGAYGSGKRGEYRRDTTAVDHFSVANAWGLCDMHGNVYEWCQDIWHKNYDGAPDESSAWTKDGDDKYRVVRGGSWVNYPWFCRSAYRNSLRPDVRLDFVGFRVVSHAPRTLER
ncbi:MAG: formylglycine-generating enzyme family protein [Leptolyngbya sp. SIO3F4]|nr:formylglycine-generating enzyme family protein [Leptolyngbya sp. SIO3F4]